MSKSFISNWQRLICGLVFFPLLAATAKQEARLEPATAQQEQAYRLLVDGSKLLKEKKPFKARKMLETAVELWPEESAVHYNLGFCYHECGDFPRAINEFEKAWHINPKLKECIVNIASCYQVQGKTQEAILWFENYLKKNPNSEDKEEVRGLIAALKQHGVKQVQSDPDSNDYFQSVCWHGKQRRWPLAKLPLKLFIANGTDQAGNSVAGFRETFNYIVLAAFNDWTKASHGKLSYSLVTDPREADIVFTWTADPAFLHGEGNNVEQGVAKVEFKDEPKSSEQKIAGAHVILLVNNRQSGLALSDDDMKKACLHEIGHALGFAGHSTNPKDVMFFSESPAVWPALTKRDKATMLKLYQDYPAGKPNTASTF
ncbi:MAG: tetratricopeptide repeat protein [Candidatus Obscuribacterales bacterium]|nr:tetratricopeptide repeat protein [Candidatus Obscuribacterales bacterium]